MNAVSTKARLLSAALAALMGLGSVAFAGGAFIESRDVQLVRLEPTVIVGRALGAATGSDVALACNNDNSTL